MAAQLEGKVVAVTGASSGIGEATALALAAEGAGLALGARRGDRVQALAERITADGGTAIARELDVTDEAQARDFVAAAKDELGRLDALVNNAGLMLLGPFEGQSGEDWRRMVEVNCLGLLYCSHAALPILRDQGGGDIVNISSVAGRRATAFSAVYNLTKFGVTAFSEALRQEGIPSNVRVTVIEPGFVETELLTHNPDYIKDSAAKMIEEMNGEILKSEDIAGAVLYAIAQPPHVCINEILVRPTKQSR